MSEATVSVVGFDLDMTLVNSSEAISATMKHVLEARGISHVTKQEMLRTIGMPLRNAFALWLQEEELLDEIVAEYRAAFDEIGLPSIHLLPGALDTLTLLARSHKLIVVSSRMQPSVVKILQQTEIDCFFAVVVGGVFGEDKATSLIQHGAVCYIGDHQGDVRGAKAAGSYSIAVLSGHSTREELSAEEPDVMLDSLEEFASWYEENRQHVFRC